MDPAFLSAPEDVATLREGLRISRALALAPALSVHAGREVWPGADVESDEQLDAYIASTARARRVTPPAS